MIGIRLSCRTLLKANPNLRNPDSLRVGSRIAIPRDSSFISPSRIRTPPGRIRSGNPTKEPPALKPAISIPMRYEMLTLSKTIVLLGQFLSNKNREHKVVDGDSLAWLAEKYGTTVKALKKLNNLTGDVIYSGRLVRDLHL